MIPIWSLITGREKHYIHISNVHIPNQILSSFWLLMDHKHHAHNYTCMLYVAYKFPNLFSIVSPFFSKSIKCAVRVISTIALPSSLIKGSISRETRTLGSPAYRTVVLALLSTIDQVVFCIPLPFGDTRAFNLWD